MQTNTFVYIHMQSIHRGCHETPDGFRVYGYCNDIAIYRLNMYIYMHAIRCNYFSLCKSLLLT